MSWSSLMTTPSFKPFWPADEKVGIGENPKRIDLGKPDGQAEVLANQLKTVQAQVLFSRLALFTCQWILRPLLWWPIKYLGLSILRNIEISRANQPKLAAMNEEHQRQRELIEETQKRN